VERTFPVAAPVRYERPLPEWMRTFWFRSLVVLTLLLTIATVVVTQMAPGWIANAVRSRLEERMGTEVAVGDVEIHWSRLAASVQDIHFDDGWLEVGIGEVEADLSWRALVRSDIRPDIFVRQPELILRADRDPEQKAKGDDGKLDMFHELTVEGGSFHVQLTTPSGMTDFAIEDISATLFNETVGSSQMGTHVEAAAKLPEGGSLSVEGQMSGTQPRLAWRFRFDVDQLALTPFNRLWTDLVEMDVESGTLSVEGELLRTTDHLRGRIHPAFENLVMLGDNEDAAHPIGEALFGHMLTGANSTIEINRALAAGSTLTFEELLATDWKQIVAALIQRGYTRRLDTLVGYEAVIGDVEIGFGMGMLTLLDVKLVKDNRKIDEPFVSVPRIDVMFDKAVAERGAKAYKHVTLWEPRLTIIAGQTGEESQIRFDERWIDKISALPFKTRSLTVHDGQVEYRDERHEYPVRFFVNGIELEGTDMAEGIHPLGTRGARLNGKATIMGVTDATVDVAFEPKAEPPNVDLDLSVAPMPLTEINPLMVTYAQVQADDGAIGLAAHITAQNLQVQASVSPTILAPKLRAVEGSRYKLRHLMLERRLRKLRGRSIDLDFVMEAGEGILHEFFFELMLGAVRER